MNDFNPYYTLVNSRQDLLVHWIPKNMCSSIKLSFLRSNNIITKEDLENFYVNNKWIHDWAWTCTFKGSSIKKSNGTRMAIIRDPYERSISALMDKFINNHQEGSVFDNYLKYIAPYVRVDIDQMTIRNYYDALCLTPDFMLDEHLKSQIYFIPEGKVSCINLSFAFKFLEKFSIELLTADAHKTKIGQVMEVDLDHKIKDLIGKSQLSRFQLKIEKNSKLELEDKIKRRYSEDYYIFERLCDGITEINF